VEEAKDRHARSGATPVSPGAGGAGPVWAVLNKVDLHPEQWNELNNEYNIHTPNIVFNVSATTGLGIQTLLSNLSDFAKSYFGPESAILSRERHKRALVLSKGALDRALAGDENSGLEIVAEELRTAAHALGRLTGRVDVEDVLAVIFRDFCIGK
jgi:tRNA modification GTPase